MARLILVTTANIGDPRSSVWSVSLKQQVPDTWEVGPEDAGVVTLASAYPTFV